MNERIQQLSKEAGWLDDKQFSTLDKLWQWQNFDKEKFAELIVAKVLDEVADRAYVSGDRAWSDDADRHWVELEFGFGRLAKMKNERTN
jgi:hypothetical protein